MKTLFNKIFGIGALTLALAGNVKGQESGYKTNVEMIDRNKDGFFDEYHLTDSTNKKNKVADHLSYFVCSGNSDTAYWAYIINSATDEYEMMIIPRIDDNMDMGLIATPPFTPLKFSTRVYLKKPLRNYRYIEELLDELSAKK